MSFEQQKISPAEVAAYGVQSRPNKLTGTAAENKAAFDALVGELVAQKLNGLIDELRSAAAAAQIGVDPVGGIAADNLQSALEALLESMQDMSQGSVADGSITAQKLSDAAVERSKIAPGAVTADRLAPGAVETEKLADAGVTGAKIAPGAVTGEKLPDGSITGPKLAAGSVTEPKLATGAVSTTKLAAGAVTAAKLAAGAVTAAKLGGDVSYQSIGLTPQQVRAIFVVSAAPVSGAADGIYLIPEA